MTSDRSALEPWGWDAALEEALAGSGVAGEPARVVAAHRIALDVQAEGGVIRVTVPGRHRRAAARGQAIAPTVGDWVVVSRAGGGATVEAVLPRRSKLSRKAAGEAAIEQVLAANVDTALVTDALDAPLKLRRIERYLAVVQSGGVAAVVVLTKADLASDAAAARASVEAVCGGAPVYVVSVRSGQGLGPLDAALLPGRTHALLGPSGVGKSTLVNRWLGIAAQSVGGLAADGRGRHTTTQRSLLRLPSGALVLDTPGMRELGLWEADETLADAFEDVEALASGCRFRDCAHDAEPDCAVRRAVEEGLLPPTRRESWLKLRREARPRRR